MTLLDWATPTVRVFGRDSQLRELLVLLEDGAPALVTIVGRGGVGKTALATEVVRALGESERTIWVPLAGVTRPELVVSEIATALGVPISPGVDVFEAAGDVLRQGERLLVLDNAEHLLAAAPILGELFAHCPNLRVLVTSQAPLRLRTEQVLTLLPLPVPERSGEMAAAELAAQPAVAVYCQRAAAVDREFVLDQLNAPVIAELCRRLDGLPLAIDLAAARAATLPAGEVLRRLGDAGHDILHRPRGDAPPRHHGLRAAIQWTYGLLEPGEQRALRRLSITVGAFDLDSALALVEADHTDERSAIALDEISSLVDFHLVDPVPRSEPPRYTLPESIRSFARAELDVLGESVVAQQLRIRLRARQARVVAEGTESAHGESRVISIEADRDDLLDALQAALDHDMAGEALDIARGLGALWDLRGYTPHHDQLLERALVLGESAEVDPSRLANAMLWSAFLRLRHTRRADHAELVDRIRTAESLAMSADDDATMFHVQCVWLLAAPFTGDMVQANAAAEEGLRIAERAGNEAWRSVIQVWAGMLANLAGDEPRAIELGMAALEAARRSGDSETVVRAVMLLGPIADRFPDEIRGLPSTSETIALTRELGLPFYEALLLPRAVYEALRADDLDGALAWMADALEMARTMPSSPIVGFDLMAMAAAAHACGDPGRTAFFHGTVQDSLPLLEQFMTEPQVVRHHTMIEAARMALGSDRFEREIGSGAALSWTDAVHEAVEFVGKRHTSAAVDLTEQVPEVTSGSLSELTKRQVEVLRLLSVGLPNKEIAAELGVRSKTVMHHTTAIYRALGVRSRSEATAVAFRAGLVE
jgi:predicted ATPase/DNA-binding CsgD family transcriptional regulator